MPRSLRAELPRPEERVRTATRGTGERDGRLRRVVSTYGWRIYALPVLAAITVLAVLDVAATTPDSSPDPQALSPMDGGDPVVGWRSDPLIPNPSGGDGFDEAMASAELPRGGSFTVAGEGTWSVVSGAGEPFGSGELFTYTVEIEDGVEVVGGPEGFATTVDNTLRNPKSWIGSGRYQFQRIDDGAEADIRISLTSQRTSRILCGDRIPFDASCWNGEQRRAVINAARWARGAVSFQGNVVQYQQYVINHEVGHGLGFPHTACPQTGALAPVMMQQSWGVSNDYLAALGTDRVSPDGRVCEPNAWPFPIVE